MFVFEESQMSKAIAHNRASGRVSRLLSGSSFAALMLLTVASPARSEERHWDANGTAVGSGGTGAWNLSDLNWSPSPDGVSGPYNAPWTNLGLDDAIFGGTAGTVTVGSPITVHNLTFNTAGYALTGGTLTLGGISPTITTNTNAAGVTTIGSVISGSAGLAKAGTGSLRLSGANTFSGDISILDGRIYASSDAALGAASNSIFTAAGRSVWLGIEGSNTARSVVIGDGGTLTVTGSGVGSALISGNGNVNVAASNNDATIVRLTNDNNSYTGSTTFNGCNGVCSAYFSSIGNIGEASSLGAATGANSTIIFNQSSQYSDSVIYIGDGDSSNRNWDINGAAGIIRNQGSGTLSITGDIDISGGGNFSAETADIELLGVLSGGNYGFTSLAGHSVTVGGGANTFTGPVSVSGLVKAFVLADNGTVSSLGVGGDISLDAGTLSYTGTGASSNRLWTISGASGILNDGAGSLNLSGGASFTPGNPVDSLTLGGSFAGVSNYSGIISGTGDLIGNGAGTWVLGGANDFVGTVTVNAGTLQAGSASAFGAATGFIVNGGTLDLGGYDLTAPSLTGTGGSVALGASTLTVEALDAQSYAGSITGTGGLRKVGAGSLSLTGASSYTGATTIAGGKLALDFSGAGSPAANIISGSSSLVLSGGTLEVIGATGATNNQTFNGMTVSAGSNTVRAVSGAGGVVNLNLGAISRAGGLINFVLPGGGAITTTNADGVLGGWATINGTDYAKVVDGGIIAFDNSDYVNKDDAGDWVTGDIVSDSANAADTPFEGTVSSNLQLGGLRYTAAADSVVTIGAGNTLGIDGTIIVAPSTLATNQRITGGSITGGAGGGTFGIQQNGTGTFTIDSTIVDNGGTGFVKSGSGTVRLNGANSYSGGTTLSGGRLEVASLANGGVSSSIGASSASSSNLVLESGTLAYVGGVDVVSDRGFTLVNGGSLRAIEVGAGRSVEFAGQVTSPDDAGLTKVGSGTLVLSNDANDYVGVTTISGGTLEVDALADGGVASGIGASSSASSNLVIQTGGMLRYTGNTATTDRGFTINGIAGAAVDVANGGTTLTFEGNVVGIGAAPMTKEGAGTLVLAGTNTYSGPTRINGGTLRAGSTQAFGSPSLVTLADVAGATLDLDGFNNKIGGLSGGGAAGGTVLLGGATLTIGGSNATFNGRISGSGGLVKDNTSTQTMVGCSNDYTGVTSIIRGTISVDCLADGGQASGIGAASADAGNLVLRDSGILRYTGGDQATNRGFTLENSWGYVDVSNAATTLNFSGIVEGPGHLAKRGSGTLVLSGANTFAGAVAVEAGTLRAGSSDAFDQGTSYLQMSNVAGALFDLNGYDASFRYLLDGGATGGNIDLGSGTLTISNGGSYGGAIYAGAITGTGNLVKNGGSYQRLTGCNSDYTGSTIINAGILEVTCLTDGGLASSMGSSTAAASSLILNGGTLRYAGAGGSTDRQFTLGPVSGNGLDASGTGAINFTSTAPLTFSVLDRAQTLTLKGTNTDDNILAVQITDNGTGLTSLTKTEAGTWILTNPASTYTGVTTISGGVLGVDKLADGGVASSIGASSAAASNLVIGSGSTLRYTGAGDTTNRLFTLAAGTSFIESSGTGAIIFTDTGPVTLAGTNQARTIALGGTNTGDNTLAGAIGDAGTGVTTLAKNDSGNWILTGNNTFSGNTVINDGNLIIGNGGTTGNAGTGNVFVTSATSTMSFNRSDTFNFTGAISGPGSIAQIGSGTTVLTATNSIGAARVDDGTLQVDGLLGTATFAMNGDGALVVNGTVQGAAGTVSTFTGDAGASMITVNAGGTLRATGDLGDGDDVFTLAGTLDTGGAALNLGDGNDVFMLNDGGVITGAGVNAGAGTDSLIVDNAAARIFDGASVSGFESLAKQSTGVLTLTGDHSYSDGTTIAAGTLRIGNGGASGTLAGDIANNAALEFNRSGTLTIAGEISGTGSVEQLGSGTTILTADNAYTGGTTITNGALQLGNGGTSGFVTGDVANNGSLIFHRSDSVGFDGLISGTGAVTQNGSGIVTLTADNSYSGATTVNAGTLLINGDQSASTGPTSVASGATLGGIGTIGGDVNIAGGGILTAGSNGVGTLSIAGGLTMDSGSVLNMEFGQAGAVGGGLNDLIEVAGDLTLDGATINVSVPTGGIFGPGIYRVFNYDGDLLNDDLALGAMPGGSDVSVQTAVSGQVNLVNSAGLSLSFWDGDGGPKFNDAVNGGNGTWHLGGTDNNWTGSDGAINAAYADGTFAIFAGTGGTVTIDNGSGQVTASGMQFASDGYLITGDALTLIGPQSLIQVGDSSVVGAGFTATIDADLTGATQLVKTDAGILVLSGTNSYTGGTLIEGGTVRISNDANLGDAAGGLTLDGGTLNTTSNIASARNVTLAGAGTVLTDSGTTLELAGPIAGAGALTKDGAGTLILTGDAEHDGGTTIAAGTLQVGNGGTIGSLTGDVLNNASLIFNRSDDTSFAGAITGTGSLTQTGGGVLRLTGASDFSGTTLIESSELRLENGGSVNSGLTRLAGPDSTLTVTGAGSSLITTELRLGAPTGGNVTLNIEDGGQVIATGTSQVSLGGAVLAGNPAHDVTVNVSGANSLWEVGGNVSVGFNTASTARVNVTDGATVRSGSLSMGPPLQSMTNPSDVTISGAGSSWTTGGLSVYRGTLSLLDGGRLDAATGRITAASATQDGQGRVLISGTGSELAIAGALDIGGTGKEAIVTVADGGQLSAGGLLTLANIAAGSGTLNIGAAAGDTAAAAGTVDVANIAFGPGAGTVSFNHTAAAYDFGSAMSGTGAINQLSGVTLLSGDSSSFSGLTSISGGALYVNNALGGDVAVAAGGTLGGVGTIGGNVTVADGALNPGNLDAAPGTLTINGNLDLAASSTINVSFGEANVVGGGFNDLIEVGGDLTLGGTLNVETTAGGSFDPGVYRVINYGGTLTDNGLAIGTIPSPDFYVQTSVDKQVNLVNTAGLQFRYWDGVGTKNDGVIDGGDGLWQRSTGNDNWVDDGNIPNAQFADAAFAVFMGAAGTVTVDRSLGEVEASGMQFLTDGYVIEGDAITLAGSQATIRVGDGTAAGAGTSATIASELTGAAQLVKSDLGTLILTGDNSYTGGTAIKGGTLVVSADANLGDAAGGLTFDGGTLQTTADLETGRAVELTGAGTLLTDVGTTLGLTGVVSGAGGLIKDGAGILTLSGANSYTGGTRVTAGSLFVNGDQSAATGLTRVDLGATLGGIGVIGGDVAIADGATLNPGGGDGLPGTLTIGGSLSLASGSTLAMQFGEANAVGGALNDLIEVGGDLVLDGTLDVTIPAGGTFGPGIYRVINYGGALTDNGLDLGVMPAGGASTVQTSIAGQVNLVNTDGLLLNFWDGNAGPKFNNAVDGGDGVWQNSTGNDNWTDADGVVNAAYADEAIAIFAGTGGTVTIDNSLGEVRTAGMQFAADGYEISGEPLTLVGPQSTIRVGDGSTAGAAFIATIAADLTGDTQLVKTDAGTLVLAGDNSYTGGTAIEGGTLAVSADVNLGDTAGGLTFNRGTLQTTADIESDRAVSFAGNGTVLTDEGTTFTLNGLLSGAGGLTKDGAGTLVVAGNNTGYTAATTVARGTLSVSGVLGGRVTVSEAGRLEGTGQVGAVTNSGVVAPGSGIGTLTVAGDYVGNGGTLEIEAVLAGDNSTTDRLVVGGGTSGNTQINVINREGLGAQTVEGIKIIDVAGASSGTFVLNGDYVFQGEQAVIAGAFGYRLYKGGVSSPTDGDWYLRSSLLNPVDPGEPGGPEEPVEPSPPLYQPGVPIYEAYGANLQSLNGLSTLQQRVGNRSWTAGANPEGNGIWGRMEGVQSRANAAVSTSLSDQNVNSWKMQIGADRVFAGSDKGERLVAGVTAYYGEASSHVRSIFGNGSLKTDGYGVGATLTWYGLQGFYADGQVQFSWYESDLNSDTLGKLSANNSGSGEAFSLELGKKSPIGGKLSVTPQIQMAYSNVRFDRFADAAGAIVAADKGDSLKTRWGVSLDHEDEWDGGRSHVYGLVNLSYEWLDGTRTRVSGTPIAYANEGLWTEVGLGASISWMNGMTFYGEVSGNSSVKDFGDSYILKANAGLRIAF